MVSAHCEYTYLLISQLLPTTLSAQDNFICTTFVCISCALEPILNTFTSLFSLRAGVDLHISVNICHQVSALSMSPTVSAMLLKTDFD